MSKIDLAHIKALPCLQLPDLKSLPSVAGIYYVVVSDHILYVGRALNICARWRGRHHRHFQLEPFLLVDIPVYIHWRECDPQCLAEEEENDIRALSPPLNYTRVLVSSDMSDMTDLDNGLISLRKIWHAAGRPKNKICPSDWISEAGAGITLFEGLIHRYKPSQYQQEVLPMRKALLRGGNYADLIRYHGKLQQICLDSGWLEQRATGVQGKRVFLYVCREIAAEYESYLASQ